MCAFLVKLHIEYLPYKHIKKIIKVNPPLCMLTVKILTDIDECSESFPCDNNANCTNTDGSFTCKCNSGYTGSGLHCTSK